MSASNSPASSNSNKQVVRQLLTNNLKTYFAGTLNKQYDIVNICMAIIQLESSFNFKATGPQIPETSRSARDYLQSSPIATLLPRALGNQLLNIQDGRRAWGLMQCMGWNLVKGASKASGKQLIETSRPDLVGRLCVAPGESLSAKYYGPGNADNQILAGLVVLENKYKLAQPQGSSFKIGNVTAPSKIEAALYGYIGLGGTDLVTGLSSPSYVAQVYYGSKYKEANGPGNTAPGSTQTAQQYAGTGPGFTVASGNTQFPPGCS